MRMRHMLCVVLACILTVSCLKTSATANSLAVYGQENTAVPFATNSFNMTIGAKTKSKANTSFSMASRETVTIKATYSPSDVSVDFGLVDSDGVFHYINVTSGSIDKTIKITKSGKYTLQVRNNSNDEIKVMGFVNY